MRDLIEAPDLDAFASTEGSSFTVRTAEDTELVLAEVDTTHNTHDHWERFTLFFRGPADERVETGIHRFGHPRHDAFDLSVTPVWTAEPNPEEIHYQANLSRHVPDREPHRPYRESATSRRGFLGRVAAALGGAGLLGHLFGADAAQAKSSRALRDDQDESMMGSIQLWPVSYSNVEQPRNWEFCDGRVKQIINNQPLFSLIGTTYGGDGQQTFALPDLRQRMPIGSSGMGTASGLTQRPLGEKGGQENVSLSTDELSPHGHAPSLPVSTEEADAKTPDGNVLGVQPASRGTVPLYDSSSPTNGSMIVNSSDVGSGNAHDNMPPFLALNFIICVNGVYPAQ